MVFSTFHLCLALNCRVYFSDRIARHGHAHETSVVQCILHRRCLLRPYSMLVICLFLIFFDWSVFALVCPITHNGQCQMDAHFHGPTVSTQSHHDDIYDGQSVSLALHFCIQAPGALGMELFCLSTPPRQSLASEPFILGNTAICINHCLAAVFPLHHIGTAEVLLLPLAYL